MESRVSDRTKLVTIWAHYAPYHLGRIAALEAAGYSVNAFSISAGSSKYSFFHETPPRHEVINDCEFEQVHMLTSFRRTLALLNKHQPRVVLACGYERPETAAALVYVRLFARGRPVVLLMLDNQATDRRRRPIVEAVKKRYLQWFDGFLIGGATHRAYLELLGLGTSPIREGYDCVDNDAIAASAKRERELGAQHAPRGSYFLCVSRLIDRKNIPFLIRAYRRYRDALPAGTVPWNLVLCGDGPARTEVTRTVGREAVADGVVMTGAITDMELLTNYYAFCQAVVLPSLGSEPWGLVVNEAMAVGCPVLVSQACGCAEDLVREGENGFTFDPRDADQLADRMVWMHCNPEALALMGAASQQLVQQFSPERFAAGVAELEVEAARRRGG